MTRRRRRTLRFAMWACVACSVITAAGWALGRGVYATWQRLTPAWVVSFDYSRGNIDAEWELHPDPQRWGSAQGLEYGRWTYPGWESEWGMVFRLDHVEVGAPLWFCSLAALSAAALCFRWSRRPIPGLCPRCGYDVAGVPAGVCPECGAVGGSAGAG